MECVSSGSLYARRSVGPHAKRMSELRDAEEMASGDSINANELRGGISVETSLSMSSRGLNELVSAALELVIGDELLLVWLLERVMTCPMIR